MEEKKTVDRKHYAYAGNENTKKKESDGKKDDNNVPNQPLANVNDEANKKS